MTATPHDIAETERYVRETRERGVLSFGLSGVTRGAHLDREHALHAMFELIRRDTLGLGVRVFTQCPHCEEEYELSSEPRELFDDELKHLAGTECRACTNELPERIGDFPIAFRFFFER